MSQENNKFEHEEERWNNVQELQGEYESHASSLSKISNNHKPIDFSILNLIRQIKTTWHLDDLITWDEFNQATNVLKSMKEAGFNAVPSEASKATDKDCKQYVFDFINDFWHEISDL